MDLKTAKAFAPPAKSGNTLILSENTFSLLILRPDDVNLMQQLMRIISLVDTKGNIKKSQSLE